MAGLDQGRRAQQHLTTRSECPDRLLCRTNNENTEMSSARLLKLGLEQMAEIWTTN